MLSVAKHSIIDANIPERGGRIAPMENPCGGPGRSVPRPVVCAAPLTLIPKKRRIPSTALTETSKRNAGSGEFFPKRGHAPGCKQAGRGTVENPSRAAPGNGERVQLSGAGGKGQALFPAPVRGEEGAFCRGKANRGGAAGDSRPRILDL